MPTGTNTENKKQNEKGIKMQMQQSRSSQFQSLGRSQKESDQSAGGFGLRIAAPMVWRRWTLKPNGKNPFAEKVLISGSGVAQEFDSVLVCQGRSEKGAGETICPVMFEYPDILLVGCWRFQPPLVSALKGRLPRLENAGASTTALSVQTGAAFFVACGVA